MKIILLLSTLLFSKALLAATTPSECGLYSARGIIRSQSSPELVINEKTKSEIVITFPNHEKIKLFAYVDRDVQLEILLDKKFNGMSGVSNNIRNIEKRIPDYLNPSDTGIKLLRTETCSK